MGQMQKTLRGFSRGMYSNWLWHRPLQLLVDAGEGLQLALGPNVFSPSVLAITHGHSDHVLGLPGLIAARRFGKGAVDKPLTIVFPEGSRGVQAVREWLGRAYAGVVFPLNWIAATPGTARAARQEQAARSDPVRHTANEAALGYRVVETRKRLKPEFASLPQAEIEAAAQQRHARRRCSRSRARASSRTRAMRCRSIPRWSLNADLLVHDATFLNEPDRREPIHATTEEALDVGRRANVKTLVLYHLSIRYDRATAIPALRAQVAASGFTGECWLLDEGDFIEITNNK